MAVYLPEVAYLYQNHSLDNTRWDYYRPRPDDIVIATSYKSGTTWMQMIVMHLIFQDLQPHPIWELSPWLDNNSAPVEERYRAARRAGTPPLYQEPPAAGRPAVSP